MRTTDEITHNGKTLTEILRLHKMWVCCESGGQQADLRGCNLSDADLRGCDLRGSDLRGCNLRGCNLSDADLRGCNLCGCDLSGCNLSDADLSEARFIYRGVEAKRFQVFNNLYKYCVYAILSTEGAQYVRLGCKFYSREDWMEGKGNNFGEFPDDGSEESELRKFALSTAFAWLDLIVKQEEKKDVRTNQP